jgi:hypothetical protein
MKTRLLGLASVFALVSVACQSNTNIDPPAQVLDATQSTVTVDRSSGVVADNLDKVQISVKLVDTTGKPIFGAFLVVKATGSSNTFSDPGVTDTNGEAKLELSSTKAETKVITVTVRRSDGDTALAQQPSVTFVAGPVGQLTFQVPPRTTQSMKVMNPAVKVALLDEHGNLVTGATANVSVLLHGGDPMAVLHGTTTQSVVGGVATFSELQIDRVGTGYSLEAVIEDGPSLSSGTFNITAGPPAQAIFAEGPSDIVAGEFMSTAVGVQLLDGAGNAVTTDGVQVTVALGMNKTGASLLGTLTQTTAGGWAYFPDLSVDKAGPGYTLVASAPGLEGTSSGPFAVTPNSMSLPTSSFEADVAQATANGTDLITFTVKARDAYGNAVSNQSIRFGASGSGNVLSPDSGVTDSDGLLFATLSSTKAEPKSVWAIPVMEALTVDVTFVPGPVDASVSTITTSPASLPADGVATTTLTVSLTDANGNITTGHSVELTVSGKGNVLSASSGEVDAQGQFAATLSTSIAGVRSISVKVDGALSLSGSVEFTVPACPGTRHLTGTSPLPLAVGTSASDATQGDFNSDGVLDVVVVNYGSPTVTLLLGNSDGTFRLGPPADLAGSGPNSIAARDLNGDGKLDLVAGGYNIRGFNLLLGNGDGTFGTPAEYSHSEASTDIVVADVNGDSYEDVLLGTVDTTTAAIFLNQGDGTFATPTTIGTSGGAQLALGDFDGDVDIAGVSNYTNALVIMLTAGTGAFTEDARLSATTLMPDIQAADLDGDGAIDLVIGQDESGDGVTLRMGFGDGSFSDEVPVPLGGFVAKVTIVDFDKDGHLDLVGPRRYDSDITFARGNGDGTFEPAETFTLGQNARKLVIDDFNADGILDVGGVTSSTFASFSARLGAGGGQLAGNGQISIGALAAADTAAVDLNGDGWLDLVAATTAGGAVPVLMGQGDGTFAAPVNYPVSAASFALAAADFNGDGKVDVVVSNLSSNDLQLLVGNGDGTFQAAVAVSAGTATVDLAAVDLNGDGKLDLVFSGYTSATVGVLLNLGNGTFSAPMSFATGSTSLFMAVQDLDGDGKVDVAIANGGAASVSVLKGKGDGTFNSAVNYSVGGQPFAVAAGDFNGDGRPDLAVNNAGKFEVTILLGNPQGGFDESTPATVAAPLVLGMLALDANGDGHVDLVGEDYLQLSAMTVLLGNGDGTFRPQEYFAVTGMPASVTVADLDGDGPPEFIVSVQGATGSLAVLRPAGCTPVP